MYRYIRNANAIKDTTTGKVTKYETVNLAKKASHAIQMSKDGGLGLGILVLSWYN